MTKTVSPTPRPYLVGERSTRTTNYSTRLSAYEDENTSQQHRKCPRILEQFILAKIFGKTSRRKHALLHSVLFIKARGQVLCYSFIRQDIGWIKATIPLGYRIQL